jgi:hypothetical protein
MNAQTAFLPAHPAPITPSCPAGSPTLPGASRRGILAGVAAAFATGAAVNATAVIVAKGEDDADAELITLVDQYLEVAHLDREADEKYESLLHEYFEREPVAPDGIRYWIGDCFDVDYETIHLPERKCRLLYTDEGVAELRSMRLERRRPVFYEEQRLPFWTPWRKKRADTIIAAHAPYMEAKHRLRVELGLDAAAALSAELFNRRDALEEKIIATPATTVRGLIAKARVVDFIWDGEIKSDHDTTDERMAFHIVKNLMALPG